MSRLIDFLKNPIRWYKERRAMKKRLDELKKRDPFIYK